MRRALMVIAISWYLLAGQASSAPNDLPSPPTQPESGPGGRAYRFEDVRAKHVGSAPTGYWLFWPERETSVAPLPIVVFLHGFLAVDPEPYRAWIDHIVRRGGIVIYPDYQSSELGDTSSADYQPNAITGIQAALTALPEGIAGAADTTRIAFVGHSLGGVLALNVGALAEQLGIGTPLAIMSVEPGGCAECGGISRLIGLPLADLSKLGAASRVLVIVGDEDQVVADHGAMVAWDRLTNVPLGRRDYIVLRSDRSGNPPLIADHYAPLASSNDGDVDALDWYGTWKFFDLLSDCAFLNLRCSEALGGSGVAYDMGRWSDGTPVSQPTITDTP